MSALVVYESMYGNTRAIAEAVADGLSVGGPVRVVAAAAVTVPELEQSTVVLFGGPTHVHGLPFRRTRRAALDGAIKGSIALEPGALDDGVRELLARCGTVHGTPAAAFDTRMPGWRLFTGSAARGISRRLRRHGFRLVAAPQSFLVDRRNRLVDGELERAREWGRSLSSTPARSTATARLA